MLREGMKGESIDTWIFLSPQNLMVSKRMNKWMDAPPQHVHTLREHYASHDYHLFLLRLTQMLIFFKSLTFIEAFF